MTACTHPIDQLEAIVAEFRHLRGEYRREGESGSWRRTQRSRLDELQQRFETLLSRWVAEEPARAAWRAFLHEGSAAPSDDLERSPPAYLGTAEHGSQVVVLERRDGAYDIVVDGSRADQAPARFNFGSHRSQRLRLAAQEWRETTGAPPAALEALHRHLAAPEKEPPWEWARALFADGLIDANFSLTARGRRLTGR